LAAIAIPRFVDMRINARNAAASANLGALRSVAAIYYSQTAIPPFDCMCYSQGAPSAPSYCNVGNENQFGRSGVSGPPCFPANTAELEGLLNSPPDWLGTGGACYNSTSGTVGACS